MFSSNATTKVGQYLFDVYTAWRVLCIAGGLSVVLTMVFMVILRCFARLLTWLTIIAFIVLLALIGYFFYYKYQNTADQSDALNYRILSIIFWCADGIFLLAICCMYDDIQLALTIIEAAAVFIFKTIFVVLTPLWGIVFTVGFIVYWIPTAIFIYSIGTYSYNGSPVPNVNWTTNTQNFWYFHLFALFWCLAFFLAWVQFVVAATATQWYFTSSSDAGGSGSVSKSAYWSIRYHLGSLAFGSFILAVVMFIRVIFEYMKVKLPD